MPVRMNFSRQGNGESQQRREDLLRVEVVDATGTVDRAADLGEALSRAGGMLGARGELRVRVVGDEEMARSHEEFVGVAGTTDVLTFDMTEPGEREGQGPSVVVRGGAIEVSRARAVDADILACVDEARRQSAARGHRLEDELLLYALHGLLHCLGHDDHDEGAYAAMHALEDAVLGRLGVGAVFSRDGKGAG